MINLSREDDGLAGKLTVGISDAVVHQVAQNDAVGVFVEDGVVNFLGVEVQGVGVYALVFELGDLLVCQVCCLDAIAHELGCVGDYAEGHQLAICNGLL